MASAVNRPIQAIRS